MRLTCPNCDAQYEIDDALVPSQGRDVECSACGQVWFQPGPAAAAQTASPAAGPEAAARPLNRQLSASVLSILQDEVDFERRARSGGRPAKADSENGADGDSGDDSGGDRLGHLDAAWVASGTQSGLSAEGDDSAAPQQPDRAYDFPLVDWPATTVTGPEDTAPEPPAYQVPPLVLPDAEKLAATLQARVQTTTPDTEAPAEAAEAGDASAPPLPEDTWSLPGDTVEEPDSRSLFSPSEAVDLPQERPYLSAEQAPVAPSAAPDDAASQDADADDAAATEAADAAADPAEAPIATPAATLNEGPSGTPAPPRHFLPATVENEAAPEGRAGYRTGFGIAVMLMVLAVTFYFLAPRLAGQGEFGARMMEWHQSIDQARFWLNERIADLLGKS